MASVFSSPYLSLYSIPLFFALIQWPFTWKTRYIKRVTGDYDNVHPRENLSTLKGKKGISAEVKARAARMEGAHMNAHEIFPLWIAAMVVGNYAAVDDLTLNSVAAIFIILRILHTYVYVNNTSTSQSVIRSTIWTSAALMPVYILIVATIKLRGEGLMMPLH